MNLTEVRVFGSLTPIEIVKAEIKRTVEEYTTMGNNDEPILSISNQLLFEMIKLNIQGVTIPIPKLTG